MKQHTAIVLFAALTFSFQACSMHKSHRYVDVVKNSKKSNNQKQSGQKVFQTYSMHKSPQYEAPDGQKVSSKSKKRRLQRKGVNEHTKKLLTLFTNTSNKKQPTGINIEKLSTCLQPFTPDAQITELHTLIRRFQIDPKSDDFKTLTSVKNGIYDNSLYPHVAKLPPVEQLRVIRSLRSSARRSLPELASNKDNLYLNSFAKTLYILNFFDREPVGNKGNYHIHLNESRLNKLLANPDLSAGQQLFIVHDIVQKYGEYLTTNDDFTLFMKEANLHIKLSQNSDREPKRILPERPHSH